MVHPLDHILVYAKKVTGGGTEQTDSPRVGKCAHSRKTIHVIRGSGHESCDIV